METLQNQPNISDIAFNTIAALFLSAVSPDIDELGAGNALKAIRYRVGRGVVDPQAIADRIRGHASFAPAADQAPAFSAMPAALRRKWLDAAASQLPLMERERRTLSDVRKRALSPSARLSLVQIRTLQSLVDRVWAKGVRL